MLGRLEMNVDQCISAYTDLMKTVFGDKSKKIPVSMMGNIKPQFDAKKLKYAIEDVLTSLHTSPDALFNDGTSRGCKACVRSGVRLIFK